MKTIKILTSILVLIIVMLLVWAAILPSELHIKQSVKIKAPIGVVFNEINDLHNWNNWSAWKDTSLNAQFEGNEKGVGAKVIWTDIKEGVATLSIIESDKFSNIKTDMTSANQDQNAEMVFSFETEDEMVTVTWSRDIDNLSYPLGRFVGYMLQKGYEHNFKNSLNSLKNYIETQKTNPEYYGFEIISSTFQGGSYFASNASSNMQDMSKVMGEHFGLIMQFAKERNIQPIGAPIVQWHSYKPESESEFTCLIPVQTDSAMATKQVYSIQISEINTLMIKYVGPYEGSYNAWVALDNYVVYNSLIMNGDPWEEYITDPATEPDSSKWITNIYFPVK